MAQSFEVFLVAGRLTPVIGTQAIAQTHRMRIAYQTAYAAAWKLVGVSGLGGGEESALKAWGMWNIGNRSVHIREWLRVYAQAWFDWQNTEVNKEQLSPRIATADMRVIMPVQSVIFRDNGDITIRYAGYEFDTLDWAGRHHILWDTINAIPGNLAALDILTDQDGQQNLNLTVLTYYALVDNAQEFAIWLAEGVRDMPMEKKERSWINEQAI